MCLVFATLWLVIFYSQCGPFVIELLLLPTFDKVWLYISLPHFFVAATLLWLATLWLGKMWPGTKQALNGVGAWVGGGGL
jgi:hypothetical protein